MDDEATLARRIGAATRRHRLSRRWTQAHLAERLDVTPTYVGMLERGEQLVSMALLVQIARCFGATVAALIGEPAAEPWVDDVVAMFRALPAPTRDVVVAMVRGAAAMPVEERPGKALAGKQASGASRKRTRRGR